jgi:hypothetical protein
MRETSRLLSARLTTSTVVVLAGALLVAVGACVVLAVRLAASTGEVERLGRRTTVAEQKVAFACSDAIHEAIDALRTLECNPELGHSLGARVFRHTVVCGGDSVKPDTLTLVRGRHEDVARALTDLVRVWCPGCAVADLIRGRARMPQLDPCVRGAPTFELGSDAGKTP